MPQNIIEVPTRGSTVVAPSSGDPVTDASVIQGEQPLADRVAHLEGYELTAETRYLVQEFFGTSVAATRLYAQHAGGLVQIERTWNARWTGSAWEVDVAGPAVLSQFSPVGVQVRSAPAAVTVGGWSDAEFIGHAGVAHVLDTVTNDVAWTQMLGGSLPSATTPEANALYAKNIPKAWGAINVDTGAITVQSSFNVNSGTTALDGTTDLRVQLLQAMSSSQYVVMATGSGVLGEWPAVQARSTGFFDLRLVDHTGNAVDLTSAGSRTFHFTVFGEQ
jgi:hypothetical protein